MKSKSHTSLLVYDMPPRSASPVQFWRDFIRTTRKEDVDILQLFHEDYDQHLICGDVLNIHNPGAQETFDEYLDRYETVYMASFMKPSLSINRQIIPLFPALDETQWLNSKFNQYSLFADLKLSVPSHKVIVLGDISAHHLPFFYSLETSSGGNGNGLITDMDDLAGLKSMYPIQTPILVAEVVQDIKVKPCVAAVCDRFGNVVVVAMTDQVTEGNKYAGNVYPSKLAGSLQEDKILREVRALGAELSKRGFVGMFGVDYLVDKDGNSWITDLNPRRIGAYSLLAELFEEPLIKLEFDAYVGNSIEGTVFAAKHIDEDPQVVGIVGIMYDSASNAPVVVQSLATTPDMSGENYNVDFIEIFYPCENKLHTSSSTIGRARILADSYESVILARKECEKYTQLNLLRHE